MSTNTKESTTENQEHDAETVGRKEDDERTMRRRGTAIQLQQGLAPPKNEQTKLN